jgi:hypothetical protein
MGWVVNATARPLYPRERPSTHYTGDWVGPRPVWTGTKNLASTGIRSPDRPARSESPYRLSYAGPPSAHQLIQIYKERPFNKAVSRRLPTANSRVQYHTRPCEICCGRRNSGTPFLRVTVSHCHYNYTSAPYTCNHFSPRPYNLRNCQCL